MSLFFRNTSTQQRDYALTIPRNSERGTFGARAVNLSSTESSLQKVAVYAAVRLLREVAATTPLHFFTEGGGRRTRIPTPKFMEDPSGDGYGLQDWLGQVTYSDAMRGNVVARIAERDQQSGKPRQLPLYHPDDVSIQRDAEGRSAWYVKGKEIDREDIWHRRSFPIPGSTWGLSPVGIHITTIGLGISATNFGAQFFLDGGHPTAIFQNTTKALDPQQTATIKQRILAVLNGSREPLVLGSDWEYKPIQLSPNESQFLETNNYTAAECARIFGPGMPAVLGYPVGDSMTYATVEQFNQQLLTFTLDPWLVRLERMIYDLLPRPQYAKFERGALLRTDMLTRFRAHEIAIRNEFETVNEVRDLEDREPVAWGNEPTANKSIPPVPVQVES